jgi:hypothetical protein
MADGESKALTVRALPAIVEIDSAKWDALANPDPRTHNPFVSHAFLSALESSGSVGAEAGWTVCHLVAEEQGRLVGAAPAYIKTHSLGEYIFDHHWAEALARAGGQYYPKLLCAAPFTPVPGPRLLAATQRRKSALAGAMIELAQRFGLSSAHLNFLIADDAAALDPSLFMRRIGIQYHWFNHGYRDYEDFLARLSSRKRKAIRRERREAGKDLSIRRLTGRDLKERHWDALWRFYQDTGGRKWGRPYLRRAFFDQIAETMSDRILMIVAEAAGRPIAGALNFIGGEALYGRYWGRVEDRPFLHFELCYHQAIEFAIERRLARVEAGAQGEHKIARGYEPVETHSAHWIADPRLRAGVARYLEAERREIAVEIAALRADGPFRANLATSAPTP